MNQLDEDHAKAVDGEAGGPYAPSSAIEIGGAGLTVSGNFTFSGPNFTIGGIATFNQLVANDAVTLGSSSSDPVQIFGTLTGIGPATFVNSVVFTGNVTAGDSSSDALTVNATATFQAPALFNGNVTVGNAPTDSLFVNSEALFVGEVTIGAALTCSSLVTCNSTVNVIGNLYVGMDTSLTTYSGRKKLRRSVITADANQTIVVRNYDRVIVGNVLTAVRDWTLDTTDLINGESIVLVNSSLQQINVKVGASTIWVMDAPSGNETSFVELIWNGSAFLIGPAN